MSEDADKPGIGVGTDAETDLTGKVVVMVEFFVDWSDAAAGFAPRA